MPMDSLTKKVLVLAQLRAELSYAELAKLAKSKEHTVRRAAIKIETTGCFIKKASLNLTCLGLHEYNIYLSFTGESLETRDSILNSISHYPGVKWVFEMTYGYDALIGFVAKTPYELSSFLENICQKNGNFFLSKTIIGVVSYHYYGRRYLSPTTASSGCLESIDMGKHERIDHVDQQILLAITHSNFAGVAQLERKLKIPASTLRFRINKLRKQGIIVGFTYNLVKLPAEIHAYRVHIYTRGDSPTVLPKLKKMAESEKSIVYIVKTLGSWNYELQFETLEPTELAKLGRTIMRTIGDTLLKIDSLAIASIRKGASYPFKSV